MKLKASYSKRSYYSDSCMIKFVVHFSAHPLIYLTPVRLQDMFETYYKQHLARRLIGGRSASEDAERSFLAKMKIEVGHAFTQKMEGMFNDMKLSSEAMQKFKDRTHIVRPVIVTFLLFYAHNDTEGRTSNQRDCPNSYQLATAVAAHRMYLADRTCNP